MITFGELRKLSIQWRTDVAAVERVYALCWLLKGIFDRDCFQDTLALRGASALSKAYFVDYPQVEDLDFSRASQLDDSALTKELKGAAEEAARASGLSFTLHSFAGNEARFEFVGPLGRRSAAQPRLPLRFHFVELHTEARVCLLLHPFAETIASNVHAVALEELAAERIALFGAKPRARDVFDLWFLLTRGTEMIDPRATRELVQEIATQKALTARAELDAAYRPLLERAWNNALKNIAARPSFSQAEAEIKQHLSEILF